VVTFREALSIYQLGKSRNLIETKVGATTVRQVFESLRKTHGETYVEKAREELTSPLYNGLEEELALAALQIPWLLPLINERSPAPSEQPAPAPVAEPLSVAPPPEVGPVEADLSVGEESDSCRLITS
jgi:hypothetical protein